MIELCKVIRQACCRVIVVKNDTLVSFGTGTVFHPNGAVLTAKHVVSDGRKVRGDIYVQLTGRDDLLRYRCASEPDLNIDCGSVETKPFPIDLALLSPLTPLTQPATNLPLRAELAEVGTDVLIAGFSDDVGFPFDFPNNFDTRRLEGLDMLQEFNGKQVFLRQLLFKKTMIGAIFNITLGNWGVSRGQSVFTAHYTLDTDISYGASGGPVVDYEGKLVAIVTTRGLGAAQKFDIRTASGDVLSQLPTGTSSALAHNILTSRLEST